MRPNVWVDMVRYVGDDPALPIQNWFAQRKPLGDPQIARPDQPSEIRIPYFLRLKRFALLCNHYKAWKFIPLDDKKLAAHLITQRLFKLEIRKRLWASVKSLIPRRWSNRFHALKHALTAIARQL